MNELSRDHGEHETHSDSDVRTSASSERHGSDEPPNTRSGASGPPTATEANPPTATNGGSKPQSETTTNESDGVWGVVGGLLFAIILGIGFTSNYKTQTIGFLTEWGWLVGLALLLIAVALALPIGRRWLQKRGPNTRVTLLVFVVVPIVLASIGSIYVLPGTFQLVALRAVFLLIVCLLPAAMWYLFIAARKASLLNEFLANLNRLGLLDPLTDEDHASRERRIWSYIQRFEASYGDVPDSVYSAAVEGGSVPYRQADLSAPTALSTSTIPVVMTTILIALGWLLTLPPGGVSNPESGDIWLDALQPSMSPLTLAFLGAYFFSIQMLFRRYVLKDLKGSAFTAILLRIVLAICGIWVIVTINGLLMLSEQQLLLIGFCIGVFPKIVWQVISSLFKRTVGGVALPSMRSDLPISDLDGLTVWHESRLEEEDIENLPNMATADLVDLMLNTRIPRGRIIDWVDQAILYTQIGPHPKNQSPRSSLRAFGIRSATSFLKVANELAEDGLLDSALQGPGRTAALKTALLTNSNIQQILRWRQHSPSCDLVLNGERLIVGRIRNSTRSTSVAHPTSPK